MDGADDKCDKYGNADDGDDEQHLKRHRLVLEVAPHDALRLFPRLTRLPNC